MEKINILPQTIFRFKCDEHLLFDTLHKLKNEEWSLTERSIKFTTKDVRLEKKMQYEKLNKWFSECLQKVKNDLDYDCDELRITQLWGNMEKLNQWHHTHAHTNSVVSGIFYLTNSNANTWFSMENIWSNCDRNIYNPLKINPTDKNLIIHKQKTVPGDLIIFPSSLVHSVDEHKMQSNPRYTMSFNSFPCGRIGNYECLIGLEIFIK
jgi:uncharacterized protein (TIGR02466 family)